MKEPNETNALLRALLTAQVVVIAKNLHSISIATSVPRWNTLEKGKDFARMENINPNRAMSWEEALQQASDLVASNQSAVLALLQARGLGPFEA